MSTFNLAIYTPVGEIFNAPVESLDAPGRDGRFGVLTHHAPMIIALRRGILKASGEGSTRFFVTGEGVLEISDGNVTVLTDTAAIAEDQYKAETLLAS
jgi:F-type H+-transporting ATPase subunit epsilon